MVALAAGTGQHELRGDTETRGPHTYMQSGSPIPEVYVQWLTHRARTRCKWTQMDKATFGLRIITPSQKQNAFSINHVDAWHLYRK